jgi:Eco29kI restriction endonuclease
LPAHANFEIDIISALSSQLVQAFSKLDIGILAGEEIDLLPKGQGVYKLYHGGTLVYVGKAKQLKKRLGEHRFKISGRRNIEGSEMGFKCLFIHRNWTALAPEDSLIRHYRKVGEGDCAWNGNGFGPHDPGRDRETTDKHPEGFDGQYPIRKDWICDWIEAGPHNAFALLKRIKSGLPYLLRYQTAKKKSTEPHTDYQDLAIDIPRDDMTAEELLRTVAQALPGWQATVFPSHLILYKESREYTHGQVIWPDG